MRIPDKGNRFRVLGIDPGSGETGYSLIDFEPESGKKCVSFQYTFTKKEAQSSQSIVEYQHGEKLATILGHQHFLRWLLDVAQPNVVVCESPFMHRRPQAFRVLAELTIALQMASVEWNPYVDFIFTAPRAVKSAMGVTNDTGNKDLMREALALRDDLYYADDVCLDAMTEHTVDSTCVALWFLAHTFGE